MIRVLFALVGAGAILGAGAFIGWAVAVLDAGQDWRGVFDAPKPPAPPARTFGEPSFDAPSFPQYRFERARDTVPYELLT